MSRSKAAEAVSDYINIVRVKAHPVGAARFYEFKYGFRVLEIVCDAVFAFATPAAAVVEGDN